MYLLLMNIEAIFMMYYIETINNQNECDKKIY